MSKIINSNTNKITYLCVPILIKTCAKYKIGILIDVKFYISVRNVNLDFE
jgi:hypothetical protein